MTISFDILDHVLDFSMYLWGIGAEDAGRGCDEVSNKQREARQAKEEETRRTGADDGVQNILKTSKHIIGNKERFPLWYHYPSITVLTWLIGNKQLFSLRTKTEAFLSKRTLWHWIFLLLFFLLAWTEESQISV